MSKLAPSLRETTQRKPRLWPKFANVLPDWGGTWRPKHGTALTLLAGAIVEQVCLHSATLVVGMGPASTLRAFVRDARRAPLGACFKHMMYRHFATGGGPLSYARAGPLPSQIRATSTRFYPIWAKHGLHSEKFYGPLSGTPTQCSISPALISRCRATSDPHIWPHSAEFRATLPCDT